MPQLETLGNVLTCGLVIVALIVVPVKLWRVWWPVVMSKLQGSAGAIGTAQTEQRSQAVERPREPSGTVGGNDVPDLAEQLSKLDDAAILDILARVRDDDGEYRYAESRVAKFIPGRVEDNLTAVRDVRGTEKPAPAGRVLRVRDNNGERVIPFR